MAQANEMVCVFHCIMKDMDACGLYAKENPRTKKKVNFISLEIICNS